ncbi:hypothetical protein U9M48_036502 [Paspalum notatum var. saurae]|uniref:Uncharacterized protein n=1 Tax=Paspalum notatum var. saurae TaxID=547442 RepID=A0AAQ3X9L6_PASNO
MSTTTTDCCCLFIGEARGLGLKRQFFHMKELDGVAAQPGRPGSVGQWRAAEHVRGAGDGAALGDHGGGRERGEAARAWCEARSSKIH